MKMVFRGWGREVVTHNHPVTPVVEGKKYTALTKSTTLDWNGPLSALGKVSKLQLTGSFLVELNFEADELKNWLKQYVKSHPEDSIRLLAEMQAEAIIELSKQQANTGS